MQSYLSIYGHHVHVYMYHMREGQRQGQGYLGEPQIEAGGAAGSHVLHILLQRLMLVYCQATLRGFSTAVVCETTEMEKHLSCGRCVNGIV
jgi:hypothetical protein